MIADGPFSPYSALLTKLLFCDSWKVTLGKKAKHRGASEKQRLEVICRWAHLSDDTTSQKRGISLAFIPVFGIEIWNLEGADRLGLDLIHEVLFWVLDDVSSE